MPTLDKNYDAPTIEKDVYDHWEKSGFFKPSGQGKSFCMMIPPPNITGTLHMGHALEASMMDAIIRYQRMLGKNTLWQVGTDHASIATQMIVERKLAKENKTRHDLGREAFLEKVWDWKKTSGNHITQQLRRLGASVDWERERFTMDEGLSHAVREVFIQLYQEGLIYRGEKLVNWDPVLHTAVSDLEVDSQDKKGHIWTIAYPLVDDEQFIHIATTRPETLLGDVALAVNPNDERYTHLIGRQAQLPLTQRTIPIIADDYVDAEFGTGCVKITPAHDFNDYEVGQRHNLPFINIFTMDAALNENVPKKYQGLDRFKARKMIIKDLSALNLLVATKDHDLKLPIGDRSGAVIEPRLTKQWFVKTNVLAEPAINAVETGDIKFIPDNAANIYFAWMRNLQDWCISRQLWWGHRIPAWYDTHGNIYVGQNEQAVRQQNNLDSTVSLTQDNDVLDTWFSSALWPFSTLGWPEQTEALKTFYPTQVLITGFDIIFFWVARMIMFGLKFTGQVPFKEVFIHGLIVDKKGKKMSKTKGNVIDPIDLIDSITLNDLLAKRTRDLIDEKQKNEIIKETTSEYPNGIAQYGTDAVRFTLCSLPATTRLIKFDLKRLEGYRNFCNKLWNAARFVFMQTETVTFSKAPTDNNAVDTWILAKWQKTLQAVHPHMQSYRLDLATKALYDFTWHQYCDWYLELAKPLLNSSDNQAKKSTQYTLLSVLEQLLCALHPFMPYISEAIWQVVKEKLPITEPSIMMRPYPTALPLAKADTEKSIDWLTQITNEIRRIRSETGISPGKPITLQLMHAGKTDKIYLSQTQALLKSLGKVDNIAFITQKPSQAATGLVGDMTLYVPLAELIDIDKEKTRLQKAITKQEKELKKITDKLTNPNFANRAPTELVEAEQQRATDITQAISHLNAQLTNL